MQGLFIMIVCRTCRTSPYPGPIFGYLEFSEKRKKREILYRLGEVLLGPAKIMIDCPLILIYLYFGLLEVLHICLPYVDT